MPIKGSPALETLANFGLLNDFQYDISLGTSSVPGPVNGHCLPVLLLRTLKDVHSSNMQTPPSFSGSELW